MLKVSKEPLHTQNFKEIELSDCLKDSVAFTHVLDYDPDGSWLIAEKAKVPKSYDMMKALNKAFGFPDDLAFNLSDFTNDRMKDLLLVLDNFNKGFEDADRFATPSIKRRVKWVSEHPTQWLTDFLEIVKHCDLWVGDFHSDNWGIRNGIPVVVDYGM